jgi:capsular polysaccharide export protein
MVTKGLGAFSGKHVLLLQGPLGPFFRRLSRDLKENGARVTKINFNGGDWLFYPTAAVSFRGRMEDWPVFLAKMLADGKVDVVLMYGDCRPIHRCVREQTERLGVELGVFEAGYVRPNYITLERSGINDFSTLPRAADFYLTTSAKPDNSPFPVGNVFWHAALWAVLYYLASSILRPLFRHYRHHRPLTVSEAWPWFRGVWRKYAYYRSDRHIQQRLEKEYSGRFFLVPLQVHYDSQMHVHSDFESVERFIQYVIADFAKNAPPDTALVIKHHPMDRAYRDYTALCDELAQRHGLQGRLIAVHDVHLPTVLNHTRGVVVVNSTVGFSALLHGVPVKVCGRAMYNITNVAYSGFLSDFWSHAQSHKPNSQILQAFRSYLIERTQMNGSVYKRLAKRDSHTGVVWKSSTASVNHAPTTVAYRLKQGMVSKAPEPIRQHVGLPSTPYLAAMKPAQPDSRVQKYH